jgi:hypothetical protein
MNQNARNLAIFSSTRPLTYYGNSDRTKKRKKAAAKIASKDSANITKYFNNLTSTLLLNDQVNIQLMI